MKLIRTLGSLPILPKIALTFLVVLTPLFFVGLRMNESGAGIVREEISKSLSSRVELYMDILDSDFERAITMLREYMNDEDLMKLSTTSEIMPDIERTESVLRLKKRLDLLKRSSSFIDNAMAFIPMMDRTVASNANAITEFDDEMFRDLSQPADPLNSPFTFWNNRVYICVPYGFVNNSPLFLLAVEISNAEISSKLKQFTPDDSLAVLVSNTMAWSTFASARKPSKDELAALSPMEEDTLEEEPSKMIVLDGVKYLIASERSDSYNTKLIMMVPSDLVEKPLERYRYWMFAMYAASVLIIIAFSFGMYRLIHRPLKVLVRSFRKIEQGQFELSIDYPFKDEFGYLYRRLNATVKELKRLIHEVYEQQYRARLAELRHLQSQINPHFLYNTFFILYRMARQEGNENIEKVTKHLGEYFQFITRDGAEEVSLDSEVAHAKSYTEIQSIRFSNRIEIKFAELPQQAEQILVPRLILQPIIENAFVHSLEKRAKGGQLEVDFHIEDSELHIRVEDSGGIEEEQVARLKALLNDSDVTTTTGMINVHRRLQIKYGGSAGLQLSRGTLGGLKIVLVIPLKETSSHA
ncbi:sensor histidine kinase [Cohnella herbarum]|uniref:Histidine kinase n=1 Tax=Cohnella herbarum TaxID=2728023 RepID=A0A7Z2VL82_9BACL|nr:histidine kinase [Cohnella herbarum]QJD85015.1 histidine kinase [Cohnella herbarum]